MRPVCHPQPANAIYQQVACMNVCDNTASSDLALISTSFLVAEIIGRWVVPLKPHALFLTLSQRLQKYSIDTLMNLFQQYLLKGIDSNDMHVSFLYLFLLDHSKTHLLTQYKPVYSTPTQLGIILPLKHNVLLLPSTDIHIS